MSRPSPIRRWSQAIRANFHRRIAVAYLEWASGDYQRVVLDWTLIEDAASAEAFAGRLAWRRRAVGTLDLDQRARSTPPCRCSTATAMPATGG